MRTTNKKVPPQWGGPRRNSGRRARSLALSFEKSFRRRVAGALDRAQITWVEHTQRANFDVVTFDHRKREVVHALLSGAGVPYTELDEPKAAVVFLDQVEP